MGIMGFQASDALDTPVLLGGLGMQHLYILDSYPWLLAGEVAAIVASGSRGDRLYPGSSWTEAPHPSRRIDPEEFLHVTKFHVFKVFHFKSLTLRTNIATRNSHFEDVVTFKQGGICELHGGYFALCHHGSSLFPVVIDPVGKLAKVRTIQKSVVKMQVCGQGARNIWMIVYVNL